MTKFDLISSINVDEATTWKDTVFLTFDLDWAHHDVINDTIDLVEGANVAATWFITHETPVLDRLRANSKFDLGIHPNFNFLLEGNSRNGNNAAEIIEKIKTIVPEAKSIRSHAMTQSSVLLGLFIKYGLTYDVNHFIPAQAGIDLKPWVLWNSLIRIPYFWEDDIHCIYGDESKIVFNVNQRVLKVFDFHPIHVFLNTENLDRYEKTRPLHQKPKELIKHRYKGYGTRSRLLELLQIVKSHENSDHRANRSFI